MLVPEFYFRDGGGGRVGSGGMFEEPPRALSGGWDGTRNADRSTDKREWGWVALIDLGSKFGSPSTLGSLASNCKAKGGGSPMGGEVTEIGRRGSGSWSQLLPRPPAPGLHPNPGSTEGRVTHSSPSGLQARHSAAASRQKGKTNKTESEGGRRGR